MKFILVLALCITSFIGGNFYQKWRLLESGPVKLTSDLEIQSSPENIGVLPKGTTMYSFASLDTETFVVFINTSALDVLEATQFERPMTVDPIDAYKR